MDAIVTIVIMRDKKTIRTVESAFPVPDAILESEINARTILFNAREWREIPIIEDKPVKKSDGKK